MFHLFLFFFSLCVQCWLRAIRAIIVEVGRDVLLRAGSCACPFEEISDVSRQADAQAGHFPLYVLMADRTDGR